MPYGIKCDRLFMEKIQELMNRHKAENDKELVKMIQKMCGGTIKQAYENLQAVREYLNIKTNIHDVVNVEDKLKPSILVEISKATQEQKPQILKKLENGELKTVRDIRNYRLGKIEEVKKAENEKVEKIAITTLQDELKKFSKRTILEDFIRDTNNKLTQLFEDAKSENCTIITARLFKIQGDIECFSKELDEIKKLNGGDN
jgi:hypothetical protein